MEASADGRGVTGQGVAGTGRLGGRRAEDDGDLERPGGRDSNSYRVADDKGDFRKLIFDVGGDRSRLVFIGRVELLDLEYGALTSPFAAINDVDAGRAAREVAEYPIGGMVIGGERLFLRHSVPLVAPDLAEFTGPFDAVTHIADLLEQKFAGGTDAY